MLCFFSVSQQLFIQKLCIFFDQAATNQISFFLLCDNGQFFIVSKIGQTKSNFLKQVINSQISTYNEISFSAHKLIVMLDQNKRRNRELEQIWLQ